MATRLVSMMFAMMLLATAVAQDAAEPTRTLSCSAAAPSFAIACFIETPVASFGGLELAIGIDARTVLSDVSDTTVAGYGVLAWYAPTWSAWIEVAMPQIVTVIGRPDYLHTGFSMRF